MNRSSFLRSLFIIGAAPKMLTKINLTPIINSANGLYFKELNFIIPDYYPKLLEKYGDRSFMQITKLLCETTNKISFIHFEKQIL